MADVTPNWTLSIQRLKSQIAAQIATIESQRLAILEMQDRKQRHLENIGAAERAIEEMRAELKGMEKAHGALTDERYEELEAAL